LPKIVSWKLKKVKKYLTTGLRILLVS